MQNRGQEATVNFSIGFLYMDWTTSGKIILTDIEGKDSLTVISEEGNRSLYYLKGPKELLRTIKYLLTGNSDEETRVSSYILQRLEIPDNYIDIAQMIDNAENTNSPEIVSFKHLMSQADNIIEEAFGLSDSEREYIHRRLSEYPLSSASNSFARRKTSSSSGSASRPYLDCRGLMAK